MQLAEYQVLAMRTAKIMSIKQMLVHGAMGVMTEAGELAETIAVMQVFADPELRDSKLRSCLVEELGDAFWFATYCAHAIDKNLIDLCGMAVFDIDPARQDVTHIGTDALSLCAFGAEIGTQIKAYEFYGKQLRYEDFEKALFKYVEGLYALCSSLKIDAGEVFQHNISKLQKRYPDKYSDTAAIARADKTPDETVEATTGTVGAFDPLPIHRNSVEAAMPLMSMCIAMSAPSAEETMSKSLLSEEDKGPSYSIPESFLDDPTTYGKETGFSVEDACDEDD